MALTLLHGKLSPLLQEAPRRSSEGGSLASTSWRHQLKTQEKAVHKEETCTRRTCGTVGKKRVVS